MKRKDDPTSKSRETDQYILNNVLAYGLRRDFTVIIKQPAVFRKMSLEGVTDNDAGLADLSLITKYRLYRHNTPEYTLGVASTVGLEIPTGTDEFSSKTWDLIPGVFTSWRKGRWSSDLSIAYAWNGFSDEGVGGRDPGDELSVDWALAYQFSVGHRADTSLFPVIELSYKNIDADELNGDAVTNTGESVLYVSPGIKFAKSSFVVEALVQIPVWQEQDGLQLERGVGSILGIRYLF
ncbi:MAG: transporter [Candidatus Omnitrophica bacterium]|nr:transporter [Candidatus Omnitrophota bacterium]